MRYFEPLDGHLWIKRYRCPDCRAVHIFRPHGYLPAFRYPLRVILLCLFIKGTTNAWATELYRQIQQGWWRTLHRSASRRANVSMADCSRLVIGLLFWFVLCDVLLL